MTLGFGVSGFRIRLRAVWVSLWQTTFSLKWLLRASSASSLPRARPFTGLGFGGLGLVGFRGQFEVTVPELSSEGLRPQLYRHHAEVVPAVLLQHHFDTKSSSFVVVVVVAAAASPAIVRLVCHLPCKSCNFRLYWNHELFAGVNFSPQVGNFLRLCHGIRPWVPDAREDPWILGCKYTCSQSGSVEYSTNAHGLPV